MSKATLRSGRRTGDWLHQHAQTQRKFYLLGALVMIPVTLFVHLVTFWFYSMVIAFLVDGLANTIVASLIVVVLHVIYLACPRQGPQSIKLKTPIATLTVEREGGQSVVEVFSGPKALTNPLRMIVSVILIAPATMWFAVRLFQMAQRWAKLDKAAVTGLLRELLKVDSRVPLATLVENRYVTKDEASNALNGLFIFDEMMVFGLDEDEPALLLGSDLREEIIKWKRSGARSSDDD